MTDIRKLAFVGLASLGLFTIGSVGCSSSSSTGTGGTSGTGTGGSSSTGTGGSSHTGGTSGTGTGGTSSTGTGGAGGGAVSGCAASDPAPTDGVIASFAGTGDAGVASMNGTFVYGNGTPKPTFTPGTTSFAVTDTIQTAGGPFYQGFGLFMNGNAAGTDCIDGSTFTGIEFDLSGSLTTGCSMVFSINDAEHADMTASTDPKAGGAKGSYAPQLAITASQITSTAMTIKVPFTGTGSPAFSNGAANPMTAVDPTRLTGVQWQLATPTPADGGVTECDWNINLSNVKLYH